MYMNDYELTKIEMFFWPNFLVLSHATYIHSIPIIMIMFTENFKTKCCVCLAL